MYLFVTFHSTIQKLSAKPQAFGAFVDTGQFANEEQEEEEQQPPATAPLRIDTSLKDIMVPYKGRRAPRKPESAPSTFAVPAPPSASARNPLIKPLSITSYERPQPSSAHELSLRLNEARLQRTEGNVETPSYSLDPRYLNLPPPTPSFVPPEYAASSFGANSESGYVSDTSEAYRHQMASPVYGSYGTDAGSSQFGRSPQSAIFSSFGDGYSSMSSVAGSPESSFALVKKDPAGRVPYTRRPLTNIENHPNWCQDVLQQAQNPCVYRKLRMLEHHRAFANRREEAAQAAAVPPPLFYPETAFF